LQGVIAFLATSSRTLWLKSTFFPKRIPDHFIGWFGNDGFLFFGNRVCKFKFPRMQVNGPVSIASSESVFHIAFNRAIYGCQLGPDLVVAPAFEGYFQQVISFNTTE
jgi:hypothetical protein